MEHVILVHGTFAGSAEDSGWKWWQKGSDFADRLEKRLPDDISCTQLNGPFHWSGKNSYGARRRAAWDLLEYVSEFESRNEPYHLVAHSHGGGVVWDALVLVQQFGTFKPDNQAEALGTDPHETRLQNLRSVTTVGTPFIDWGGGRWERLTIYLFLSLAVAGFISAIALWAGIISGMVFLGAQYFVKYGENLFVAGIFAATFLTFWIGSVLFIPARIAGTMVALALERGAAAHAAINYGNRLLILFSDQDEAVQSLRAALTMNFPVIPRSKGKRSNPFDILDDSIGNKLGRTANAILLFPYRWTQRRVLAPMGDKFFWSVLRRNAYGADREGAAVVSVDVMPPELKYAFKPLPKETTSALVALSQRGINTALPEIRKALAQYSSGTIEATTDVLSLDDTERPLLVHTSYFECDDIADLISAHIHRRSRRITCRPLLSDYLDQYFSATTAARRHAMDLLQRDIENKGYSDKKMMRTMSRSVMGQKFTILVNLVLAVVCLKLSVLIMEPFLKSTFFWIARMLIDTPH